MERFLYRLSRSKYADRFVLKGALLFKAWAISDARSTRDIDMWARTSNALPHLINIATEICSIPPALDDGVVFDLSTMQASATQIQREYEGARIQFEARLGSAQAPMQLDLGFGDVITPAPRNIVYPVLLDFPAPELKGYPLETAIAEKLQTVVEKGTANSRVKDLYDIWLLLHQWSFKPNVLVQAVRQTCLRRGTVATLDDICSVMMRWASVDQAQHLWQIFQRKQPIHPNCPSRAPGIAHEVERYLRLYFEKAPPAG